MGRKVLAVILVVLAIVALSMLTSVVYERWCGPGRGHGFRHAEHPFAPLHKELALTKDQIAQLEAQRSAFETELQGTRMQLREKRQALMEALTADKPDTLGIDKLVEEIGALQVQIEKRMIRHTMDIQKTLTPEQRQKFYSMFHRHFLEREEGPWMGPGGGPFDEMGRGMDRDERPGFGHKHGHYAPPDSGGR